LGCGVHRGKSFSVPASSSLAIPIPPKGGELEKLAKLAGSFAVMLFGKTGKTGKTQ
jgi:hypothetical protein